MRAATPAFVALLTVTACDTQPASVVAPHLYHDASQATGAGARRTDPEAIVRVSPYGAHLHRLGRIGRDFAQFPLCGVGKRPDTPARRFQR